MVLVILGILAMVVVPNLVSGPHRSYYKNNVALMLLVERGYCIYFRDDVGRLPLTLDELLSRPKDRDSWSGPYTLPAKFRDPWGKDYIYEPPKTQNEPAILPSHGEDGKPGGTRLNQDRVVEIANLASP